MISPFWRVARSGAHVGEAKVLQKLPDMALVIINAESPLDDALQIDAPPADHAIDERSGPVSTISANATF
jgi:hypothetical protein